MAQAAQQLWQVVRQAGLAAHLQALRGYYLLGQGDFYHAFLARVRARPSTGSRMPLLLLCSPVQGLLCPACSAPHTAGPHSGRMPVRPRCPSFRQPLSLRGAQVRTHQHGRRRSSCPSEL